MSDENVVSDTTFLFLEPPFYIRNGKSVFTGTSDSGTRAVFLYSDRQGADDCAKQVGGNAVQFADGTDFIAALQSFKKNKFVDIVMDHVIGKKKIVAISIDDAIAHFQRKITGK